MNTALSRFALAAAGSLVAAAAHATPVISWVGTNSAGGTIGGVEQICKTGSACAPAPRDNVFFSGWILEGGYLTLNEAANVTVTYWGKEAGFRNRFLWNGAIVFTTSTAVATEGLGVGGLGVTPLQSAPDQLAATGTLPFAFRINTAAGASGASANLLVPNSVANVQNSQPNIGFFFGENPLPPASPNAMATTGTSVWLLLDDGCGFVGAGLKGCDDDHDDMLIELTVTPVPEPGTLELLAAGILALGGVLRRRRGSQA